MSGEWVKYTVRVTKSGDYRVVLRYGTPARGQTGPELLIDDKSVGQFETAPHKAAHRGADTDAALLHIPLKEGDHEIVLLMQGSYNVSTLTFEEM